MQEIYPFYPHYPILIFHLVCYHSVDWSNRYLYRLQLDTKYRSRVRRKLRLDYNTDDWILADNNDWTLTEFAWKLYYRNSQTDRQFSLIRHRCQRCDLPTQFGALESCSAPCLKLGYSERVLPTASFWGLFSFISADFEESLSFKLKKSPENRITQ